MIRKKIFPKHNKACIIIDNNFLLNKAGGFEVFKSNLETLFYIFKSIDLIVLSRNSIIISAVNNSDFKISLDCLPVKIKIIHKTKIIFFLYRHFIFLYTYFKYNWVICEHFYNLPLSKYLPNFVFNNIIYSHHDFLHRIKALRDNSKKEKLEILEWEVISKCKAVIAGNASEISSMTKSCDGNFLYLPIHTKEYFLPKDTSKRVYHVGSYNTTASRLGFEHFIDKIFPLIDYKKFKVIAIGQGSENFPLIQDIEAVGFVNDLSNILHYGSIQIVPWNHNTGQRTRVFDALSRGNVIISYDVIQDIVPELIDGVHGLFVKDEIGFAKGIEILLSDDDLRFFLAKNARLLSNSFSLESRVQKFESFLNKL